MGADINIRLVGTPVASPIVRPAPEAALEAVRTALPADRSVTASDASLQTNMSAKRQMFSEGRPISREVMLDREAGAVVYLSIDSKTNQIINQYPEEFRLRSRAYLRAMDAAREDRRLETDRRA